MFEVTLNNGVDPVTNKEMGLKTGDFATFNDFEELFESFKKQAQYFVKFATDRIPYIYENIEPCLFLSMLMDDCISNGKGLMDGVRYKGFKVESHGLITVADSLTAIKELVFDKKLISAETLLNALKANFEGYQKELNLILDAPKYGNDNDIADAMASKVINLICSITNEQAKRLNVDYSLPTHISVDAHVYTGVHIGATADGRKAGEPITNSANPLSGNDCNGVTALLNSMLKVETNMIGGQVQHLKLNKYLFTKHSEEVKALLKTYFDNGGSYLCITVLDRGDLEEAVTQPEKYPNLMVRVGGFSARFVELPAEVQKEIVGRTLY